MKRFLLIVLLVVLSGAFAFAQSDLQPVAIVSLTRSEPITVKQLKTKIEEMFWQEFYQTMMRIPTAAEISTAMQRVGVEQRQQVLDAMINERLAVQAAERDRITVTDNELNQEIQALKTRIAQNAGRQPTEAEFAQAIKEQTGQDYPVYRDSLRRRAIVQRYLMSKKEAQLSNIPAPTDAEILNHYNLSKAQYVRPDTIRFTMIQVLYGADEASKSRARDLANRLSQEIGTDPSKFDEVVIRGQTPNSGYMAGDFGYLPRNMQAMQVAGEDFINTAFALTQGQVSKVIEGIQGFQIIKVTESLPQKALELDDIVQPGTSVTVRQYIGTNLQQERQMAAYDKASQELVSELRSGNPFQIMTANINW